MNDTKRNAKRGSEESEGREEERVRMARVRKKME